MIEINNNRYYSIDEFPNYIKLKGKSIKPADKLFIIDELRKTSRGAFYADGIVNAIIAPPSQSVFAQMEKQITISGMVSILYQFITQKEHGYIEIFIKDGVINGRPSNHKERILLTNPWQFYCILQNRNYSFFKCKHYSMLKENIIPRLKSGRPTELPDLDLFFDAATITSYCNDKGLSIDLDKIHLQEQIVSERAKEITDKWVKKTTSKKPENHSHLSAFESAFVLSFGTFLKSNKRNYNSKYIQIGIVIIHLIDDIDDSHHYAIAIRDIAKKIKTWVNTGNLTIYDAINHLPTDLNNLKKIYEAITVTKLDGFNVLLNKLISIDQLIEVLQSENFKKSRIDFFIGLTNNKFPDPINHFKTQTINLLSDLSELYKKINFPIPIVAASIKNFFESHPLINDFPAFNDFYSWLESNYELNTKIKKVNPREIIFDDGDQREKSQIRKNFDSIISKIKQKLSL